MEIAFKSNSRAATTSSLAGFLPPPAGRTRTGADGLGHCERIAGDADGGRVGATISFSLAADDLAAAARPAANEADWDHRYGGGQIWSGNPNGTLVNEMSGVTPGRALDVGAGEGGDALWLAEQGWRVTASDISQRALDRIDAEARRRGLHLERHHADAKGSMPTRRQASTSYRRSMQRFPVHPMAGACAT